MSGERLQIVENAPYLGVTLRGTRIAVDKNLARIRTAFQRLGLLKAAGVNRKFVSSARLVDISRTYVYPAADYGIHLMPLETTEGSKLKELLELLDYRVVEYALGCIAKEPMQRPNRRSGGRLPRHLKMAKLPDWT